MTTRKIKSIPSLLEGLRKDVPTFDEPIWFRGHSKGSWKLVPAFHRLKKQASETDLINKFRQNANLLVDQTPNSDFAWLFLMQHYGVPTRLLDWTESPLVGLYFAVTEHPKSDGDLWILKPMDLNRQTTSKPAEVKYIPSFEDQSVQSYATIPVESGNLKGIQPLAVIATRNNDRIQAQQGVFTISHSDKTPIEQIGDRCHVIRYTISKTVKPKIIEELRLLGFTKFQIFPELSSIGDLIRKGLL